MDLEKTKKGIYDLLKTLQLEEKELDEFSTALATHEIDASILSSKLLNHDLLKEVGIKKLGHRLKILSLGKAITKEEEDFNEAPKETLSLDEALKDREESGRKLGKEEENELILALDEEDSESEPEDEMEVSSPSRKAKKLDQLSTSLGERAKFIPVRLSDKEKHQLKLVEAALNVSDYTGTVDVLGGPTKRLNRSHEQLKEICAILSGLLVASDYAEGKRLIADRDFEHNEDFFQTVFEIGRRHKIMNPEKMRTEYGKLVYLLMDSSLPEIMDLMGFSAIKPVITVYSYLEERKGTALLQDKWLETATMAIVDDKKKKRSEIQREIKNKEAAVEALAEKYASQYLTKSDIKLCLRSMGDNASFLIGTRDPVESMLNLLQTYFKPDDYEKEFSLAISYGQGGARLSHDHSRQYAYALQSLLLWREITNDMFRLWILAEKDLLDSHNRYKLQNTGQGMNRVQQAPSIGNAMSQLLSRTKKYAGDWVGSSVVHLGDHNVPNALMFIDKYTQVPRIINPILITIQQIDEIVKDEGLKRYVQSTFGGPEVLKKTILADFFKHAFDGSGADNFYDAGSCIDGRLTSAWNWCEKLGKKAYYPIFKLSGFSGFDGDFR
eukprot:TRINITY_DN1511_c0_g1_i2.p1 TRINITY_DN1511_c0_g1~~TRINITY_DN1511_c0_g1_i2.p1  ORF type:complete len:611 (+),score=264.07 TRINITY_DN1511_c0_g1_i2:96-1928(+)